MQPLDYTARYCVIGAGSSGITVAKNLKEFDIPFDVIESEDDVSGNRYDNKPCSSVRCSTQLITSK